MASPTPPPVPPAQPRRLGTFAGVFTPTVLTILGVILYLRLGWVVGQAGLLGAWLVVGLSVAITAATGLSLSSIATNTRLTAGGAYGIVSRSLGLEVGGSVGLPLYLSQALVVAMYVFGFREGWLWLFPEHPALVVDLCVFVAVFGLAWWSAAAAFKVQYVIMAVIALSVVSILLGDLGARTISPVWVGELEEVGFWGVFGVFFPAATGVLAGANMSGELTRPRRSIPVGTLTALGLSSAVYLAVATWAAVRIPADELVANTTAIIDHAAWRPVVLAGLLGATFSSAVTSMVGAPRILQAMGGDGVLPGSAWFGRAAADGEPRNALLITGGVALLGLFLRNLNTIAPLITLFFLLTYLVVNLVVLLEGRLGLTSFRPTFRVPLWVSLFGVVGCGVAMVVVQPLLSMVALLMVAALYTGLARRHLAGDRDDVRSGLLVSLAEWAARRVSRLGGGHPRAWRPNVLLPARDAAALVPAWPLLLDLAAPEGSVKLLGVGPEPLADLEAELRTLRDDARAHDLFATATAVGTDDFVAGVTTGLQALQGAFFQPNLLLLSHAALASQPDELRRLVAWCAEHGVGVALLGGPPPSPPSAGAQIRLWVRPQAGADPLGDGLSLGNLNLSLLLAWRLARSWRATIELRVAEPDPTRHERISTTLGRLVDVARLPANTTTSVETAPFSEALAKAPPTDLQLFGLPKGALDLAFIDRAMASGRPTLFLLDSGQESARA